jgi:hypothetical protein
LPGGRVVRTIFPQMSLFAKKAEWPLKLVVVKVTVTVTRCKKLKHGRTNISFQKLAQKL